MHDGHVRLGLSGTGHIAKRFANVLRGRSGALDVILNLRRRDVSTRPGRAPAALFIEDESDRVERRNVVVGCTGTARGTAKVAGAVTTVGMSLAILNGKFRLPLAVAVTATGSVTGALGRSALRHHRPGQQGRTMGFQRLFHELTKGFLDKTPFRTVISYRADGRLISFPAMVQFTNRTDLQFGRPPVATGIGARPKRDGFTVSSQMHCSNKPVCRGECFNQG